MPVLEDIALRVGIGLDGERETIDRNENEQS